MASKKGTRTPEFDPEKVRDISVAVYCDRLDPGDVERILERHGEEAGRAKIRRDAMAYDALTRCYMRAIKL